KVTSPWLRDPCDRGPDATRVTNGAAEVSVSIPGARPAIPMRPATAMAPAAARSSQGIRLRGAGGVEQAEAVRLGGRLAAAGHAQRAGSARAPGITAGFGPIPTPLGGDAGEVEADDAGQNQADRYQLDGGHRFAEEG